MIHSHDVPYNGRYQTPPLICDLMVSMIPEGVKTVLEPTPGEGRLVEALKLRGYDVTAPARFEEVDPFQRFDCVVMNPPFKNSIEIQFLRLAMEVSDNVIALMPWFTIINSDSRAKKMLEYGLPEVISLPRRIFPKVRVQTCIMRMERGYLGETLLEFYDRLEARKTLSNIANTSARLEILQR